MLKTFGGAKHARMLITLTAVCSLVLGMLAAGVSPVRADDPTASSTPSAAARAQADPKKDDLREDLEGEIATQEQSFVGGEINVAFTDTKKVADGSKVDIWLFSTPTDLGTKIVKDGTVNVTIPNGAALGSHTLAAYGEDGDQLGWTSLTVIEAPVQQEQTKNDAVGQKTVAPMAATANSSDLVITARTNVVARSSIESTTNNVKKWQSSQWQRDGSASVDSIKLGNNGDFTNTGMTNGASYRLHAYNSNTPNTPGAAINDAWATCAVASDGKCTITVPNTHTTASGGNFNKQFWVVQVNAPAGTYINPDFVLGNSSLGSRTTWNIAGLTQPMAPASGTNSYQNGTFPMARAGGYETDRSKISYGAVPYSIINPAIQTRCDSGIKIAMVLDVSGSTSDYKQQYKDGITGTGGLLDGLASSSSSIATFTFGENSPRSTSLNNVTTPTLIKASGTTDRTNLNKVINDRIDANGGYTNWDAGLQAVKNSGSFSQYDYVLFVTDGAPNRVVNNAGTGSVAPNGGSDISVAALEAAVYSSNAIKASGKPVIGVGVGTGVAHAGPNLRAISGETEGEDYFKGDWASLNDMLKAQAQAATCTASVTATKEIPDGNGGWKADNNWQMDLGVDSSDMVTTTPDSRTQNTDANGKVNWNLAFTQPNSKADVTVSETQKDGWEFKEGFCKVGDDTIALNSTTATIPGVERGDQVNCTFRNSQIPASWNLEKTSNPGTGATVKPGDEITYTLKATNPSNANVGNIVVNDDLAQVLDNTTLVGVTAPAGTSVNTNANITSTKKLTWNVGTLAKGANATLTYKVKVNGDATGVTIKNTVTGNGQVPPNNCTVSQPCETTHVTPKWTLKKTSDPATGTKVVPGQKISYTLEAKNLADADIEGVFINDDLAKVVDYAAVTGGPTTATGTANIVGGSQLVWNLGKLVKGATATVTYEVTVNADAAGVKIENKVSGNSTSVPPVSCTEAVPCTTTHETDPTWSLAKTSNPGTDATVKPGDEITYTVTATNGSKGAVKNVVVSDNLTQVLNSSTLVGTPVASIGSASVAGNTLTWNAGDLAAGATATVTYKVKVNDDAFGVTVKNVVTGDGSIPPASCTSAVPCETTHDTDPIWTLVKSSDPASGETVKPGDVVNYTVTAHNPSGKAVKNVVVNDDLSDVLNNAELEGAIVASEGSASVSADDELTWTLGTLKAGETETVKYSVKVADDAYGVTIKNVVTGEADDVTVEPCPVDEGQETNNDCRTTTHPTDPTWSLAKTSNPGSGATVVPGQEITYTVTAKNPSKSAVTGVVVNDDLADVLENSTMVGVPVTTNGLASVVGTQLVWENVTLAASSESTVTYTVKVNDDANGVSIRNLVTGDGVVPPTTCVEGDPCATTHDTDPVWTMAKTSDPATGETVKPGDTITYTVSATNKSKVAIEDVAVNDDMSKVLDNATLVENSVEADAGTAAVDLDAKKLTWTIPSIAADTTVTVAYKVTVNEDANGVTIGNVVSGEASYGEEPLLPEACTVEVPCETTHDTKPVWTMDKVSDPATGSTVQPGDEIKYTVSVVSKSKSDISNVVVTDDLANVLNNAALTGGPTASVGDATHQGNDLKWTIPSLEAGKTETVTYTVTVNQGANGVTIGNVVSGIAGGDEDALIPEKCAPEDPCDTTHNTPPIDTPTGPTEPAVTPTDTPTDNPSNSDDPAVTPPTDGGNNEDQGVLPQTGAGLTVMAALLALVLIGAGLVLRYASRTRRH